MVGVSSSAVSRVLNYDEGISVSDETREAIFATAEKIGYKKRVIYPKIENVALLYFVDHEDELEDVFYHGVKDEWRRDSPRLYDLKISLNDDAVTERFGFRWFEIKDVKGDRQFFLNGKRIVLRTAISWGFWPYNGITPSDELTKRQITIAKELGLNMLNFHRNIGQTNILDYADELGLLYFEEPGGNQYPIKNFNDNDKQSNFYFAYRNEKLARMVKRDRNHPSLIIYNLHNERGAYPQTQDYDQMRMAHALDPTRILTYNSSNGENPAEEHNTRFKLHLMPYDTTFYDYGWYDRHHAGGPGCYHDNLYLGKDNYHRFSDHKKEIVYWGEDGAIGTPPRLN